MVIVTDHLPAGTAAGPGFAQLPRKKSLLTILTVIGPNKSENATNLTHLLHASQTGEERKGPQFSTFSAH